MPSGVDGLPASGWALLDESGAAGRESAGCSARAERFEACRESEFSARPGSLAASPGGIRASQLEAPARGGFAPCFSISTAASFRRPRASLDITVPIGKSATTAISRYPISSSSRRISTSLILHRQLCERFVYELRILVADQQRLRIVATRTPAVERRIVHRVVEFEHLVRRPTPPPLRVPGTAHDRQQPRPRGVATKGVEEAESAHERFLDHIVGIVRVTA